MVVLLHSLRQDDDVVAFIYGHSCLPGHSALLKRDIEVLARMN